MLYQASYVPPRDTPGPGIFAEIFAVSRLVYAQTAKSRPRIIDGVAHYSRSVQRPSAISSLFAETSIEYSVYRSAK